MSLVLAAALVAAVAPCRVSAQAPATAPAAAPVAAKPEPPRPKLRKEDDPNDWRSYYVAGLRLIERRPERAAEAFYWAGRLNPAAAEPLHARWVSLWRARPSALVEYLNGAEFMMREPEAIRIDSLLYSAMLIDPFVSRQLVRWLYEALPGEWGDDAESLGFLAYSEGRFDEAARHYADALRKSPKAWRRLEYYRALAQYGAQQYDSAAASLERLAQRTRAEESKRLSAVYDTPAIYDVGVGTALLKARRLPEARAALMRALGEDVTLASAHTALGHIAMAQGVQDEALNEYRMATELRPNDAAVWVDLGVALLKVKEYADAVTALERAIAIEPYYCGGYFNLAATHERMGDKAAARRRYQDFLDRAPRAFVEQVAYAEDRVRTLGN